MSEKLSQSNGRPIGFSTGCLYRYVVDTYSAEALEIISRQGLGAIEVMCADAEHIKCLPEMIPMVKKFSVKSLHLPVDVKYGNNRETRQLLGALNEFYQAIGATLTVVHPDQVVNWDVFKGRPMRLAVENMDCRKKNFRLANDFAEFFEDHPDWLLVLDLNHCAVNDRSLKLADDFISRFGERIAEIHLSGYTPDNFHLPLYQSHGQKDILNHLPAGNCPIIIESPFQTAIGPARELYYITRHLKA